MIGVILARLLSPDDYGLLAMIAVFNAIAFAFLDSGFGSALVRKPDLTEDDNTTAFFFNLAAGAVMFGIIWIIAPWVSIFYDKPILTPLLRAEGSLLIVSAFKIVQNTQLTRALNFKAKMIIRVVASVFGGVAGIIAAYSGLGVWALVTMHCRCLDQSGFTVDNLSLASTWQVEQKIIQLPVGLWFETTGVWIAGYSLQQYLSNRHR